MKLHIHKDKDCCPEKEVFLKLKPSGKKEGGITLCAVDKSGLTKLSGKILTIREDGTITLHTSVSKSLGFKLTPYGQVVIN